MKHLHTKKPSIYNLMVMKILVAFESNSMTELTGKKKSNLVLFSFFTPRETLQGMKVLMES